MGYTSGFPIGAAIAAQLRQQGRISKREGERLIAFTNNPSPAFIAGGIAAGILQSPESRTILLGVNYGVNLALGIILARLHRPLKREMPPRKTPAASNESPWGTILKNAAARSAENLLLIGCYLVFFSVIAQAIEAAGIIRLAANLLRVFYPPLEEGAAGIIQGLLEMTIGIKALGNSDMESLLKLSLCSALLSFGGISVMAQVQAMISKTDIGMKTYIKCRAVHCCLSFFITLFLGYFSKANIPALRQEGEIFRLDPFLLPGIAFGFILAGALRGAMLERRKRL
jgi:sporulation integral membrane protein YlbJ